MATDKIVIILQDGLMARRSQHEHLKPQALSLYRRGVIPLQVATKLGIPKSTAYDWFKEFKSAQNPVQGEIVETIPETKRKPEASPQYSKNHSLTVIDGFRGQENSDSESDYAIAQRTLREVSQDENQPGSVRVQAALGLARLVVLRAEIPSHILHERSETSLQEERKSLEGLSAEELARQYKEELQRSS